MFALFFNSIQKRDASSEIIVMSGREEEEEGAGAGAAGGTATREGWIKRDDDDAFCLFLQKPKIDLEALGEDSRREEGS